MSSYVRRLDEVGSTDVGQAGGKGASLGELARAGFPVPAGFVITTDAYTDFLTANGLRDCTAEQLRQRIPQEPVPDEVGAAVRQAYDDLGAPPVAVRSSGTAEDLADASFAGQHDTYLDIRGQDAVLAAVRDCWASLWTPRAVAYRQRNHWDETGLAIAVVVQTMVDAEWAGVMFTADPVSGRRDRLVVEAVRGLGEALVSGQASGLHLVVDRATGTPVSDPSTGTPGPDGETLPAHVLTELVELGTRVEEAFGRPQDIEWTYASGGCALVQARPLTALPEQPTVRDDGRRERPERRPGGRRRRSRRRPGQGLAMAADHVPYPPYPMDVALSVRPALAAILDALRSAGLSTPPLDEVLTELDNGVVQIVPPRVRLTPRAVVGLPRAVPKVVRLLRTRPDDWRARCRATLMPVVERVEDEDLTSLSDAALLDRVRELRSAQGALVASRFGAAAPRIAFADALLAGLLRLASGTERGTSLHTDLLTDIPCVSREAAQGLDKLAGTIHDSPALAQVYRDTAPDEIPPQLQGFEEGRALLADVDAYLRAYGYRQLTMPMAGFTPLREDPAQLHGMLKGLSRQASADRSGGGDGTRADRARAELTTTNALRTRLFGSLALRLVAPARAGVSIREDSHYYLFMVVAAVVRRVLLEVGRRFVQRGLLDTAADVFYLELDELSTLAPPDVSGVVARRRAARDAALVDYSVVPADLLAPDNDEQAINGISASRGTATGPARVILDEAEFGRLGEGDVLVCRYTNPAWTPLFSLASAVVADAGGAASHAAIVAREYGIPAVMGTGNATRVLSDGQQVRVDGDHGTVVPL